ncbi:hypothetical protein BDP81DRAFT_460522 [Colletotrichum phormii]|uniref:UNC93-like protein n=1 Tax=Colletotrichum phormii TaxID=359342 RepID=A0AAI9ZVU7_9PEZI|nr:uncharacterized protein BDP81DRAFT_460522 [Colletotrichum phormii]KAK1637923.1 hypothetical protein BDP81DRAFT_460522 [Colletotrichum phormii]
MSLEPSVDQKGAVEVDVSRETPRQSSPIGPGNVPPSAWNPTPFFRSTLFQILVVGLCAFCAPGIWSAMNGLGVGGSQSPDLVNAANALLYAFMTLTCFAGPFLTNLIGFRWTLAVGALGYPLYAAGLYVNNRTGGTWLVYFGSVACGISAGFFYSVEGAIATAYPEHHKRGHYVATWFTFPNFGMIIGGAISLALNHKVNQKGKVGYELYLAFIGIQCLGFFFGLFLSNPDKVMRDDGSRIEAPRGIHWRTELIEMWKLLRSRSILLLTPLFCVRSRALGSFVAAIVSTFPTWVGGSLVDLPWSKNRQTRALATYSLIVCLNTATWIWAVIIQNEYRFTLPVLDWAFQSEFGRGFGLYPIDCELTRWDMLERASLGMIENFIYWAIGNLSDSPGDQIRHSSLLRGIETAAVAVGFGIQAVPTPLIATARINCGLWFIALPFSYFATLQVVKKFKEQGRMLDRMQEGVGIVGQKV